MTLSRDPSVFRIGFAAVPSLETLLQLVKVAVCEDRAANASLWRSEYRRVSFSFPQVTCSEAFPDQVNEAFVRNLLPEQ